MTDATREQAAILRAPVHVEVMSSPEIWCMLNHVIPRNQGREEVTWVQSLVRERRCSCWFTLRVRWAGVNGSSNIDSTA